MTDACRLVYHSSAAGVSIFGSVQASLLMLSLLILLSRLSSSYSLAFARERVQYCRLEYVS